MRYFKVFIISVMTMLITFNVANANEIDSIDIYIDIKKDGSVEVTEHRFQNMDEGTENYIVFNEDDMQGSKLLDFKVDGFKEIKDWDEDASLEEKAGKYGVLDTKNGFDLVWGIGEYGDNEYTIHYTLSDLVHNLKDGQALYWDFNTFTSLPTDEMTMTISSYEPFTKDNVKFYGFGIVGHMGLVDGNIVWKSSKEMNSSNYATVLLQFNDGMYNASINDDKTLEEQRSMALHNSNYNEDYLNSNETSGPKMSLLSKVLIWVSSVIGGIFLAWTAALATMSYKRKKARGHIEPAYKIKKELSDEKTNVSPDVRDYAGFAYLLSHLGYAYFEQFITVYLIQWQRDGRIDIEYSSEEKKLNKRETLITVRDFENVKSTYDGYFKEALKEIKHETYSGDYELLVWLMFIEATESGTITKKELEKWFKKNTKDVSKVADYLQDYSKDYLEKNDYMDFEKERVLLTPIEIHIPTEKGKEIIEHFVKYSNYLEHEDENQWLARVKNDEITTEELVFVYLLGVSEEIESRFKKYKLNVSSVGYTYPTYFYLYNNTTNTVNTGLSSGGFSSAAAGTGGATGVGGGAGAGGGGGGGAR